MQALVTLPDLCDHPCMLHKRIIFLSENDMEKRRISFATPEVTEVMEFDKYDHALSKRTNICTRQGTNFTKALLSTQICSQCVCTKNANANVQCSLCGMCFLAKKRKAMDDVCSACHRGMPPKQVPCIKCGVMVHQECFHGQRPECVQCHELVDVASHRLHTRGVAVFRNAIELDDNTIDAIYDSRYVPIFNGVKNDALTYDGKRLQAEGEWRPTFRKKLECFLKMQGFMRCNNGTKHIKDVYALKSLAGCPMQPKHADSAFEEAMRDTDPTDVPLAVIYALEPDTRLMVWTFGSEQPSAILMQPRDLVVFRGDAAHAGFKYDIENTRLHAYIDSTAPNCKRVRGKTYILVDDSGRAGE